MRRPIRSLLLTVLAVVGAIAAPATIANAQTFKIVLSPAVAVVSATQHEQDFLLVNDGAVPVHVVVTASDGWITPAETSFDIAARQRHTVKASIAIPADHDAGDHESDVLFTVPPVNDATPSQGLLHVSFALASRVLINAGGTVVHDLHVFGLAAPVIADSWDAPVINLTVANHGNVHEIADIRPFGQVLLLRGQVRVVSLQWSKHPWIGRETITAGGETASTLFLPWRLGLGLLALLAGLGLLRASRHARED